MHMFEVKIFHGNGGLPDIPVMIAKKQLADELGMILIAGRASDDTVTVGRGLGKNFIEGKKEYE